MCQGRLTLTLPFSVAVSVLVSQSHASTHLGKKANETLVLVALLSHRHAYGVFFPYFQTFLSSGPFSFCRHLCFRYICTYKHTGAQKIVFFLSLSVGMKLLNFLLSLWVSIAHLDSRTRRLWHFSRWSLAWPRRAPPLARTPGAHCTPWLPALSLLTHLLA